MFNFPWSNFHELNLDWILSVVKEAKEIFVKGEGDIQHAVETADQALETAEQAAAGVIADGAVTIPKLSSEVYSLLAYCVSGSVAPNFIPAGALVILRKSTIYNVSDGIYTATRNIPQAAIITAADLDQSATLYREGGMNYLLHNEEKLNGTIDLIKAGLVILVTGDEASAAVPADGLVYVTNNTHGLTEGFYFNSSGATFPPTGGTADGDSFTAVNNILNALQTAVATLGSDDIANDSTVTGASVTDALDAVKNTLKRNYILIGDSFSIGYTKETASSSYHQSPDGWSNALKAILLAQGHQAYNTNDITAQVAGTTGFASALPFLTLLQLIEDHVPNNNEITDIIVLGGSNDIGHENDIESAIDSFVSYAKSHFPFAEITVGCLGSSIPTLYNNIAPHYKHASDLGCRYLSDLVMLMCDYNYYCPDNVHLTEAGYTFYKPYIIEAIITGSVNYKFLVDYTLTKTNTNITVVGDTSAQTLAVIYQPNMITCFLSHKNYYLKFGNLSGVQDLYSIDHELKIPRTSIEFGQVPIFGTKPSETHIRGTFSFYLRGTDRLGCVISEYGPDTTPVDFITVYPNFGVQLLGEFWEN